MNELTFPKPRISPALARSIPFAIYIAFLAIAPWIETYLPDGRWLYVVKVAGVAVALGLLAPQFDELRATWRSATRDWLLALAVGVAIFILWINLDQPWASIGTPAGYDPRNTTGEIDYPLAALRVAGACLVVPVMEELFWRSFIMRWIERVEFRSLAPASVAWRGLLISSVLFGFEHNLWLAGIVAGLAYGYLYMRSGNLWSPIIAHAVTNFLLGIWVIYSGNWKFW
jgi:CAAX prenyl protease-like protein